MENKTDLREEINRISNENSFAPRLIEKDYHLTRILYKISEKQISSLVFKGGTCLNKCYLGFYRLSEDLDFVFNRDVKGLSKMQIKKILDNLRRIIFEILNELDLETNNELGKGWKMLTSKEDPKIVGLEITANYNSLIDNSLQKIKIEISFRNKLINPTKIRPIHHEFVDALGQPILKRDVKIEVIDLAENFAEKVRALITRKNLAVRDIYDIYFILKNDLLVINKEIMELILTKINEGKKFTKEELGEFLKNLNSKASELNEKEISAVIRTDEKINIKDMVQLIINKLYYTIVKL